MPSKKISPKPGLFPPGTPVQAFPERTTRVERREGRPPLPAPSASGVIGSDGTVTLEADAGPYVLFAVTNEKQSLKVEATGGKYTLVFGEDETAAIAYNATAEEVQEALEALESIGEGNVEVTGGPGDEGGTKPYVITFKGELTATNVAALEVKDEVEGEELEGGEAQATVTTTATGAKTPTGEPRTVAFTIDAE